MRRIPRPTRAVDSTHAFCSSVQPRISPLQCRSGLAPCTHLRTSTAAFSTTPARAFLLPAAKQDKKKHQQFVRRWQKRLLGDSEPIGAHVDPYDPTSPVRIAPEDQGEYEEVLDDDRQTFPSYEPARKGRGLLHVGGEQWLQQKREGEMAKEFEKLTLRTYTPLTLEMANEIEDLTGTPYTLRDENLLMAQTVHEVTGRPYTEHNFGLYRKVTTATEVRNRFVQAVAEVYALKQVGLSLDISKSPNRGVYNTPRWIKDIRMYKTESGDLALAFPKYKSAEQLVQIMQSAPALDTIPSEGQDLLVEEAVDPLEPALAQEQVPTMDPDTPAFKRAAVVKIDAEQKPFDFMSNRPVPRAKPVEEPKIVEEVTEPKTTSPSTDATSQSATSELQQSPPKDSASRPASDVAPKRTVNQDKSASLELKGEEVRWRAVPIATVGLKFALFKRLLQLTGIRISDPQLSSTKTLGDLYSHLCAAAKPRPTSLFTAIHVEGQKARERAKQQTDSNATAKRRVDLGDLINLGNVELRRVKPTKTEKRTKTGLEKVVQYALWERGLSSNRPSKPAQQGKRKSLVLEGTRSAPEFGKPMSSKGATFLAKKTREWREEQERQARESIV